MIATWTTRNGCPEAGLPGGHELPQLCRYCGRTWVSTEGWLRGSQITGEFTRGAKVMTCDSCANQIGRGAVLDVSFPVTAEPDPAVTRADDRMRMEAMIVRGRRHHNFNGHHVRAIRKQMNAVLGEEDTAM